MATKKQTAKATPAKKTAKKKATATKKATAKKTAAPTTKPVVRAKDFKPVNIPHSPNETATVVTPNGQPVKKAQMVILLAMLRLEGMGKERGQSESGVQIAQRLFKLKGNAEELYKTVWVFNQKNGIA